MRAKVLLLTVSVSSVLIALFAQDLPYITTTFQLPAVTAAAAGSELPELRDFRLISAQEGWLLLGQRLHWTKDGGQSWTEITPVNLGQASIQAVWFEDTQTGWLALTQIQQTGTVAYIIARTSDGGATWQFRPLSLFAPGDSGVLPGALYLHFVDVQTGWLVVKHATSRNFSVGSLFKTSDGGQSWTQLSMPIGELVYFVTRELGWTAGGPAGDQLYRTRDGGQTWQAQQVGRAGLKPEEQLIYHLPSFTGAQNGVLPVIVAGGINSRLHFYITGDGGESWKLATAVPLDQAVTAGTVMPLEVLDARHWALIAPQSDRLLGLSGGSPEVTVISRSSWIKGIVGLNLVTPNAGWARYVAGSCTTEPGQNSQRIMRCTQETRLLATTDGGQTWLPLTLPLPEDMNANRDRIVVETVISTGHTQPAGSLSGQALGGQTRIFSGHGFDKCEIASPGQLQDWMADSPYRAVNLYIGGSSRYCSNAALSASLIAQLSQQGWQFIPTWVGPQAACTGYPSRMSFDLATAYSQGMAEANAAIEVAYNLGLTLADKSGAIIYYDLEYFDSSNIPCYDAAKAFIAGWSGQLKGGSSQAGVYSTGSILNGFAAIPNIPDAIWPAHWIYSAYNPDATVWDVYNLSNSLWNNQQRIRQYTGGHNETWASITLNIDSDVIEGVVVWQAQAEVYLPVIVRE